MRLDFNETNILAQVLAELEKNPKAHINKIKIIEALYALGIHTDKKYAVLKVAVKSLISKLEMLSDDDVGKILLDNQNSNIVSSVCYQLPTSSSGMSNSSQHAR